MRLEVMVVALATGLTGCGGGQRYTIDFAATVAGKPFACGQSYAGIGTSGTTIVPQDLRFYVHDVALHAGSTRVPLTLVDDGEWQHDGVALLDFEDGTGGCDTNSPATNEKLVGTAPANARYDGVEFTLGVSLDDDALDVVDAEAPLDLPDMFFSPTAGYRFTRIEVGTTLNPVYHFDLGADECSNTSLTTLTCKYPDQSTITLDGWKPDGATVNLDLARLYAASDLDARPDGVTDSVPGCLSTNGDPECPALFGAVGLSFESSATPPLQTLFVIE